MIAQQLAPGVTILWNVCRICGAEATKNISDPAGSLSGEWCSPCFETALHAEQRWAEISRCQECRSLDVTHNIVDKTHPNGGGLNGLWCSTCHQEKLAQVSPRCDRCGTHKEVAKCSDPDGVLDGHLCPYCLNQLMVLDNLSHENPRAKAYLQAFSRMKHAKIAGSLKLVEELTEQMRTLYAPDTGAMLAK